METKIEEGLGKVTAVDGEHVDDGMGSPDVGTDTTPTLLVAEVKGAATTTATPADAPVATAVATDQARPVTEPTAPEAQGTLIKVAEAVWILKPLGLDLERELGEFSQSTTAKGLMRGLQTKGISVTTPDQLATHIFENARSTKVGIQQLAAQLDQGRKFTPVFDPGSLTPGEVCDSIAGNVVHFKDTYCYIHRDEIRVVWPEDFGEMLATLNHRSLVKTQVVAFKRAYNGAPAIVSGGPRILFAQDSLDADGKTATSRVQAMQTGARFMPLEANLIWHATQIEKGRNPKGETQSPNYVYAYGGVAQLSLDENYLLSLEAQFPGISFPDSRSVLE